MRYPHLSKLSELSKDKVWAAPLHFANWPDLIANNFLNRGIMQRRKLNRAWEILRSMPMPAIASDRLVDLHNDVTDYDVTIAQQMREFVRGKPVDEQKTRVDMELEDSLRAFKTESPAEVECRRELLKYKRRVDDVIRELLHHSTVLETHYKSVSIA